MLVAFLTQLLIAAAIQNPQPPTWAIRCTEDRGLQAPSVVGTPKGDSIVVINSIVVARYDAAHRTLAGRSTETGRILSFGLEPRTQLTLSPDSISPGDNAMLRLIIKAPCTVQVDDVAVNVWVSYARVLELVPGGFRFDKLDYHTAEVDNRLAREDGSVVPQVAAPLSQATFNLNGTDHGMLSELAPGMRLKIYGQKSPRSKVVHFYRVEEF